MALLGLPLPCLSCLPLPGVLGFIPSTHQHVTKDGNAGDLFFLSRVHVQAFVVSCFLISYACIPIVCHNFRLFHQDNTA